MQSKEQPTQNMLPNTFPRLLKLIHENTNKSSDREEYPGRGTEEKSGRGTARERNRGISRKRKRGTARKRNREEQP